jgi:phosphoglycerate dehydrogenase-like enzyme
LKKLTVLLLVAASLLFAQAKKKIVVVGFPDQVTNELRSVSPGAEIVSVLAPRTPGVTAVAPVSPRTSEDRAELLRQVADADGFIGAPTREVIQAAKKLKWVQIPSAGVEAYRYPELIDSNIVMTNFQKVASPGIADHAMGMLLALTRRLNYFITARTQENWVRQPYGLLELQGMTAVVIGVGGIGSNVAVRAWAAGMKVIGVDPRDISPAPYIQRTVYPDRLDSVLPEADVVFVCAPDTPESKNMLGPKQFDLMKKGSFFIAVSRGGLYSLDALVNALKSGKVAGAGVDVTSLEPLPKGHPLWKFENVIITPHIATQSQHELTRQLEVMKENIARFVKGEPLKYVVDKRKGY